ncbi:MAG TPA: hypothetical protein VGH38_08940, partial [Bryobacteraceae bacterium]
FGLGLTPGGISISPDGRIAAFVGVGNGKAGLWVQPLDSGTPRLLPGTEDASFPFWSPDSRFLAFFSGEKLQRVDPAGGTPFKICDLQNGVAGAAWSSDGYILIAVPSAGIFRVPVTGGSAALFTKQQGLFPQILPGGRFLYWSRGSKPGERGVYAASLADPGLATHLVTTDSNGLYAPGGDGKSYLLFLRGTALLAQEFNPGSLKLVGEPHPVADPVESTPSTARMNVAASATGLLLYGTPAASRQLEWLDRAGKRLGAVGEAGEFSAFRLSPDGLRAALTRIGTGGGSIWLLETARGVATRFSNHPTPDAYPVWSPDSATLAFASAVPLSLFRKPLSGNGSEERLAPPPAVFQLGNDWSRDGRLLLYFDIGPGTQEDIWCLRVPPPGKVADPADLKAYLHTPARELNARFSPESDPTAGPRFVAYQSDESGRSEVYVDSFPEPRHKVRISINGGQFPEWGPSTGKGGRELYFVSPDYKLMMVTVKLAANSVEPSAPIELFWLPSEVTSWTPYQVSADGQRFLVLAIPPRNPPRPLTMLVNWSALVEKKATAE